jgi:hypothetical protein
MDPDFCVEFREKTGHAAAEFDAAHDQPTPGEPLQQ